MKQAGWGWYSAAGRVASDPRTATRTDAGPLVGARRRFLLEAQWQGRDGGFRHIAVRPPGLRRVAGALGVVVFLALTLGVAGTFSAGTDRPLTPYGVAVILHEHTALKVRNDALRERAFDLAEQLYAHVEQGRRMVLLAGTTGHAWEGPCPRPPARDAGDEAIFAWLAEQGARLEAIGNALTAGRVEPGVIQASAPPPETRAPAPVRGAAALQVADLGPVRQQEAAPTTR